MNNTKLAYIAAAIARNRRAMRRYEAVYNAAAIQQHEDVARVNGSDGLRPLHESAEAQNRMAIRIYGMAHTAPAAQMLPIIQAGWPKMVAAPAGITPLAREGWLALPNDNAPGAWFIVSEAWYLAKFPDLQPHYTGASDE